MQKEYSTIVAAAVVIAWTWAATAQQTPASQTGTPKPRAAGHGSMGTRWSGRGCTVTCAPGSRIAATRRLYAARTAGFQPCAAPRPPVGLKAGATRRLTRLPVGLRACVTGGHRAGSPSACTGRRATPGRDAEACSRARTLSPRDADRRRQEGPRAACRPSRSWVDRHPRTRGGRQCRSSRGCGHSRRAPAGREPSAGCSA